MNIDLKMDTYEEDDVKNDVTYKKPPDIFLPDFINTDEKWDHLVKVCTDMDIFKQVLDRFFYLGSFWSTQKKLDILNDFTRDIITEHNIFNPFWNRVLDRFEE